MQPRMRTRRRQGVYGEFTPRAVGQGSGDRVPKKLKRFNLYKSYIAIAKKERKTNPHQLQQ
jgi:hypothetical protein